MGLEEKDTSAAKTVEEKPVKIEMNRADGLPGVPITITVTFERIVDGVSRKTQKQVSQTLIDDNWDGPTLTLKDFIFAIIDNAE